MLRSRETQPRVLISPAKQTNNKSGNHFQNAIDPTLN
jgi:hypothetical protein